MAERSICEGGTTVTCAAGTCTDPNHTVHVPVKAVPVMVAAPPPARGETSGVMPVTSGPRS